MSNRKANRSNGRTAHALCSAVLFEGLEPRQLLSVTMPHQAGHHASLTHTFAQHDFALTRNGATATPAAASSPVGLSPSTVRHAYGIDSVSFNGVTGDGSGQTIAIVDAYNAPTIASDLATFNSTFNLPGSALTVVGQNGTSSLPGLDPAAKGNSWAVETSLDVEWAHAIAPRANLLLVEANSASLSDLFAAVDTARNAAGVSVVSMSFGTSEFSSQSNYNYHFTTPAGHSGVTFLASSGDYGAYSSPGSSTISVQYPAASPNVIGVGGTRLTLDSSGNYSSESGWGSGTSSSSSGGAGGGISHYTSQPSYQNGVVTQTSTARGVPDVAFLADPASGVAVIDSYDFGSASPWLQVGGTSLAAPMWAGVIATVNQGRILAGNTALDGASQTLPKLYSLASSSFHDITTGNNGYAAVSGYDLVTGRGTPIVNVLAPALAGTSSTTPTPGTPTIGSFVANPATVTSGSTFTLTATNVQETNGTISSVKFYEETNGTSGLQSSDTLIGSATQTSTGTWTLSVSSTGVSAGTYGLYAVATDASGVNSAASSAQVKITSATPANDNFASAQALSGSTVAITANSVNATREAGEPYIQNNRGGHSVWFVWTAPTSKKVTINTHGSNFDTLLGVYTGTSVSALTRIASNDDDTANRTTTSAVTINAVAGQTYRIAVDGYNGASGNISLNIA